MVGIFFIEGVLAYSPDPEAREDGTLTIANLVGCDINDQEKIKLHKNFDEEMKKRGIKKEITVNNKKLKINKDFTVDHCFVLYGNEKNIPNSLQKRDPQGEYLYLGYDASGKLLNNIKFRTRPSDEKYFKRNWERFITKPWNHKHLLEYIKDPSTTSTTIPKKTPKRNADMRERELTIQDIHYGNKQKGY